MKVIIVGMGIAGLTAAITSSEQGDEVWLVVKNEDVLSSASAWAQGGIVYRGEVDGPEELMEDMKVAATGMTRQETLERFTHDATQFVEDFFIKKINVPFQKKPDSASKPIHETFELTREAGHQCSRILFSGDKTGEILIHHLFQYLKEKTTVKILWNHLALDLINIPHHSADPMAVYEQTHCVGLYVFDKKGRKVKKLLADKIILATGGIGQMYKHSTNPPSATGDGIAIASRAGARIINMEFTQFHPTSLALKKASSFLISEALRGEGAVLINESGEEFMKEVDTRGSLTPRDKLSRAIVREQQTTHEEHVYLSLEKCKFDFKERFPKIHETCTALGLDLRKGRIPVTPAFHFSCGGILTGNHGETSVERLYAAGECACTGVHGANRLASTALLEASYFAHRAALHQPRVLSDVKEESIRDWEFAKNPRRVEPVILNQDFVTLRGLMWNYVGVIRENGMLSHALSELSNLKKRADEYYRNSLPNQNIVEFRNTVQTAILVTEAAIKNTQSIGSHYRAS